MEEDVPVTATLSFQTTNPVKIETRATDISKDNRVSSLAIFIFKQNGDKVGDTYICTQDELKSGNIKIHTTSGTRYIYAIANYENSLFDLTSTLNTISTFSKLKQLNTKLLQESISVLDGEFLMSGCVVPDKETYNYEADQSCSIGTDGVVNGKIQLRHVMAAVNFKVKCTNGEATFTPTSWQVKKLSLCTNVFEQKNDYQTDAAADYFNSKANADFTKDGEGFDTFSFLMMENRKKMKSSGIPVDSYDKREKTNDEAEKFVVANDNSTYLVLHGTYEGMTTQTVNQVEGEKYVKAQVTYYIHLGVWKEKEKTDYTNFDIFRNNRYTYTVSVAGVDNLIVEVETDNETWGGDGNMFLSSQNIRTFDAHFETTVISFSKQQILDLIKAYGITPDGGDEAKEVFKENFVIQAATPRNGFVSNTSDINWVKYRRNQRGVTTFAKYKDASDLAYGDPLDADGFKEDLFEAASDNEYQDNDSIRYTCFIDEYYYGDEDGNYDTQKGLSLKEFINTQPRTIQISTYFRRNDQSPSTVSMAAYTFSQRPICTIYDLDCLETGVNGWGLEWSQEGENLSAKGNLTPKGKNYYIQGRVNTKGFITETRSDNWDYYIDYKNNDLQPDLKYAEFACLTRNRDLNGNGIIDENELRWYLPAVKQYLGFIMGEDVLPKEARLYRREDEGDNLSYSYISSTFYRSNYYVLLAYEGTSFKSYGKSSNPYRCVRNLRNVTNDVANFVEYSNKYEDGYGDRTAKSYSFGRLNSKAKRNNVSGPLTFGHNTFDEENRLPEAFEVSEWFDNENEITASYASLNNPCADLGNGWRLPNQRELAVIAYNRVNDPDGLDISNCYFSCTKSAYDSNKYCGYNQFMPSMTMWDGETYSVAGQAIVGFRCIKDKNK
ncbi:fimbrial protein [Parabacteroides goldsteinii]